MSDSHTMYDNTINLEAILLPPLKKDHIKHSFRGWKSLALLHSWDDLKVFNTDFDTIYKYEKFKKNYKNIIKNEKQLLSTIKDYKISKAKAKQLSLKKHAMKTSKTHTKSTKHKIKSSNSNNGKNKLNNTNRRHINTTSTRTSNNKKVNMNITNNNHINNNRINNNKPMEQHYTNNTTKYYNTNALYYNNYYAQYNTPQYPPQYQYNNYNNYPKYNTNNNIYYYTQQTPYNNTEITEMISVENSPPSDGNITSLSESNNSCSTIIST